jgi:S-disulfanyl-L-cysteine oxidoreductase SoxD
MSVRGVRAAVATASFVLVSAGARVASQTPVDPVTYSDAQATRGEEVFSKVCVECHTRKDMTNAEFRGKWNGRTMFELFDRIRSTMPESNPGGLSRGQYLDVTTYLAKINGIPAGAVELPDDDGAMRKQVLALPPPSHRPAPDRTADRILRV